MDRDTCRPLPLGVIKGDLITHALRDLDRPRRAMARDLLVGSVRIPAGWLTRHQASFVAFDEDVVLDAGMQGVGLELAARVIRLCALQIPQLIETYLAGCHARPRAPDHDERESLRRGAGPAAVRNAIFAESATWPTGDLDRFAPAVERALDRALDARRRRLDPPTADPEVVVSLVEQAATFVTAYSGRVGLRQSDAAWLLSEVSDQLARNVGTGRLPRDVRSWALATAARKWKNRSAVDPGRHPRPGRPGYVASAAAAEPGRLDDGIESVDLVEALRRAGGRLAARAEKLRRLDDMENAAVHDVAAAVLRGGDAAEVTTFLLNGDEGAEELGRRLSGLGIDLTAARRLAAVMIIRETLRDALGVAAPQPGPAVS